MPSNHLKFHSADGKRKILVVEDEMINREMLKFLIQDDYALAFAETGKEAFDCLEREAETLSLVLLDLNLPDMKGVEILRRMKGDGKTARLPVIVMTYDMTRWSMRMWTTWSYDTSSSLTTFLTTMSLPNMSIILTSMVMLPTR